MFEPRIYEDNNFFMLRWSARIFSAASLIILLLHIFSESSARQITSGDEAIGRLFVPAGLMLGLILSWRTEFFGGAITLASILAFYFIYGLMLEGSLAQNWWVIFFAIPGVLFLTYGITVSSGRSNADHKLGT